MANEFETILVPLTKTTTTATFVAVVDPGTRKSYFTSVRQMSLPVDFRYFVTNKLGLNFNIRHGTKMGNVVSRV